MIVFKKLKTKRIKPFKVLDDDEPEAPAKDDESQSQTEIERHNSKRKAENAELIAPIKRRKSDHTIFGSGIDDDDSIIVQKKRWNTDALGDEKLDNSPTREWNQDVSTTDADAAPECDCHTPSPILPTGKKKYPQKRCVYCRVNSTPRDTRYYCKACVNTPALCKTPCFESYHCSKETSKNHDSQ